MDIVLQNIFFCRFVNQTTVPERDVFELSAIQQWLKIGTLAAPVMLLKIMYDLASKYSLLI